MNVEAVVTVVMAVAMAFLAAGCGESGEDSSVTTGAVSYQNDIQPIWDRNCIGCHSAGSFLDLRAGVSFDSLASSTVTCIVPADGTVVDRPAVVPGDPNGSALHHKLANMDDCGREMPLTGTGGLIAIDREAFDLVEAWIADGAAAD